MLKIGKSHILTVNVGWTDFQHVISFYVNYFGNHKVMQEESMDSGFRKHKKIFSIFFPYEVLIF